ncbi:hypothetical protein EXS54_00355 [Patescibacteria group bacterium]|nr:hypothetical protein [Patescibacteria group bacterium]
MIPGPQLTGVKSSLERAVRPAMVCHRKPDGDAVGSTLGLAALLRTLGSNPTPMCIDPVPLQTQFLPGSDTFRTTVPDDTDLIVMLDCGSDAMPGLDATELRKAPLVDIDHHPHTGRPPTPRLAVYDIEASSTAEMVYAIARHSGWKINRQAATCLLTGIVTDTSAFQNTNVTPATLEASGDLLRRGARFKEIIRHCFYSSSVAKLRLWGIAMARMEQSPKVAGVLSTVLTAEDIAETGATSEDTEGLADFLKSVPGLEAMLLLTDLREGEVKGSLRAGRPDVDISGLAELLGGGGHTQAAGFRVPGRLVQTTDESWVINPPSRTDEPTAATKTA